MKEQVTLTFNCADLEKLYNLANNLANRGCSEANILAKSFQAMLEGNAEQALYGFNLLIKQEDCLFYTTQCIFPHVQAEQNYSHYLKGESLVALKNCRNQLNSYKQQGVNINLATTMYESMFRLESKHQEAREQLQAKFGKANHPSVQSESKATTAKTETGSNEATSANHDSENVSFYKKEVGVDEHKNVIDKLGQALPEGNDISKTRNAVDQRFDSVAEANKAVSVKAYSTSAKSTSCYNPKEDLCEVGIPINATEPPTKLGPKDKVCYFKLLVKESTFGLPNLALKEEETKANTYICSFFLVNKEGQEDWNLTDFTQEFRDKKLLPIDFGSQTSALLALFIANLLMSGCMSIRQTVSMLDCLGVTLSKTTIQNIKKIVDDNVFAPTADAFEQLARELADVIYLDETNYRYLDAMIKGLHRSKVSAFIQQICSGPRSNFQFTIFRLMDDRKTQTMDQVIDLASFENLYAFGSDGLPQYITLKEALELIYQRCIAHAFRYAKAPFIDLLKSAERAHFDLDAKKITQEEFDNFISSKQRGLDDYDRNLFEITYGLQTIFFIEDKAKDEASILVASQKAEGEEAKQIYLQTIREYRQNFTSKIKQNIERSFGRLQAIVKKDSMISTSRQKAFTYLKNAFDALFNFIDKAELEAHNNYCEGNFKSILRIRRNNNDIANSREEVIRVTHYRTQERSLYGNGVKSLKDQMRFQFSMQEAQFVNATKQATALIFATHNPVRDPKTGFFDITPFITQFKISHFTGTFDSTKFVFEFLSSIGTSFPSDLSDNLNRLFRREELTIQVNRSQSLETYLKRFKFESRLDEIKLSHPNLFNCDAALSELKQMDAERLARQQARLKTSGLNSSSDNCTSDCKTKNTSPSSNKAKRGRATANKGAKSTQNSPINQHSANQGNNCSYIQPVAS